MKYVCEIHDDQWTEPVPDGTKTVPIGSWIPCEFEIDSQRRVNDNLKKWEISMNWTWTRLTDMVAYAFYKSGRIWVLMMLK